VFAKEPGTLRLALEIKKRVLSFRDALVEAKQQCENKESTAMQSLEKVNALLSEYPMQMKISTLAKQPDDWDVSWGLILPTRPRCISGNAVENLIVAMRRLMRSTEPIAVHGLVGLAEEGLLDRLQLCACGKWYFGRFSHQRFCSPACRVKFWEDSEERKEQKRQRARENYLYKKAHKRR
jgi:hypothetical protein